MYWELMAKAQREMIPIFDKCKETWQHSNDALLLKKMQSIYHIIPRLKVFTIFLLSSPPSPLQSLFVTLGRR
jgi:hypothetical protein